MESDTINAPAIWASYLINGDHLGLDDQEIYACDIWKAGLKPWYVVDTSNKPWFSWSYRSCGGTAQGGNLITYTIHFRPAA